MHYESTARCFFGLCHNPATRVLTIEQPLGGRIECLCDQHAARNRELYVVLEDYAIDEPIPFTLTPKGCATIGRGAA